jgi:hypothetical protein
VDEENIRCEFRDGVLNLHLPKSEQRREQGRRIPVGEGEQSSARSDGRIEGGESRREAEPGERRQQQEERRREPAMAGSKSGEKGPEGRERGGGHSSSNKTRKKGDDGK